MSQLEINNQKRGYFVVYALFGLISFVIMMYYLSNTIIHFTSGRQFPINSFSRFPLTMLIFPAEIFSFLFSLYFVYTLLSDRKTIQINKNKMIKAEIAILLPVYNEPKEIVERTLKAAKEIRWNSDVNVYLLDDSTNAEDKQNMEMLSKKYQAKLIRRTDRIGYKAGNINNAVKKYINEDYFVVFDSDQVCQKNFLEEAMPNFSQENIAFVQTPQDFVADGTALGRAAKLGANVFYFAQCNSKSEDSAIPFCGTNVIVRTDIFKKVGGFAYYTSTEDIDLGMRMNSIGFKGVYVTKVLAHGQTPPNFKSYSSQQYRWANGNLAILRENLFKLFGGNFSFRYQVHMFFTLGWWLIGVVSLVYIIVPLLSLIFGLGTHHTWLPTTLLSFLFLNVIFGVSMIYFSLNNRISGEKVSFTDVFLLYSLITNSMFIYIKAAFNALVLKRYIGFVTTNKRKSSNEGLYLIKWNLLLGVICFGFSIYALYHSLISGSIQQLRTYLPASLWLLFYSLVLFSSIVFIDNAKVKK